MTEPQQAASTAPIAEMTEVDQHSSSPSHPHTSTTTSTSITQPTATTISTSAPISSTLPTTTIPAEPTLQPQTQAQPPPTLDTTTLQRPEPAHLPPPTQPLPSDDHDAPISSSSAAADHPGTAVQITLLLTTGPRHPFTIDPKYLSRRNINVANDDPFSISVYTMKELIWRDWREDWEARPSSPGAIRLIHFGKLLEDGRSLRDCRFQPHVANVVHMTVKPQDIVDEEENAKGGKAAGGRRGSVDRDAGCRCCVVM